MNHKRILIFCLVASAAVSSCIKDRIFPIPPPVTGPGNKDSIVAGTLVINEFMASGSTFNNELANGSDWIEIYNTTNDTITLAKNKWYITDSVGDPLKFIMPEWTINPKSYLIVWCDDFDTVITQIHSNFKLSSSGEQLGLFYKSPPSDSLITIDAYTYGNQVSGLSFGRLPDGANNWTSFSNPTPGNPNQ